MTSEFIFYLIVGLIIFNFFLESILDYLNYTQFDAQLPSGLQNIYDQEEYQKSQSYKKDKFKFGVFQSLFSLVLILVFLAVDGFQIVNSIAESFSDNSIVVSLIFFGILFLGSEILGLPFSYYFTFSIEERYGFNTSTVALFWKDKFKSMLLSIFLGGVILGLILVFYNYVGIDFWWYTWILVATVSVLLNMFYAKLFVPLFNKQTPLEEGELRSKIETYASRMNFNLKNIFVIDGSKRSKKANAYFSGFGSEKRITLFDTLIEDLDDEEIVAVLAHEVGHYKKNHIIINLVVSILTVGFTLWVLSLFVSEPVLAQALGVEEPSFHIGLVAFSFLYAPISLLTGILTNILSRKFEFQADNFAKATYKGEHLVSALKKLTKKSLSNLTPHSAYVFFHFSHPPLSERLKNLENNS
ncbi:M48 family metallopeptidase [Psychroflexus montanilacus]|uniref:M48 family metallopeptidase n=1 Tax=Psychroflexus montanilacus TaxID=2873598 RepID=UPI001CD039EC|nr:M48 family metallopeptidase [Psychroflexus montanilacus]MBZ9651214.1 M48 family metallopeptidase [Psychroflexus montanilacus]